MGCTRPPNCSQMRLTRPVHSRGTGLYFNGNFLTMRPSGKSHLPCSSWVANIDFKLCCSLADGHKLHWKVESSSSKATIVRIGAESLKIFPSRPENGTNGLSFFALEGKIERRIKISARKRPGGPGLSKQQCPALTSSIESCVKPLKNPQNDKIG